MTNPTTHSALSMIAANEVFTSPHIALTAIFTGVIAAAKHCRRTERLIGRLGAVSGRNPQYYGKLFARE